MSGCDADKAAGEATKEKTETKAETKTEQCQEKLISSNTKDDTKYDGPDPCTDPNFGGGVTFDIGGDPQEKYRELCRRTTECKAFFKKLTECNERVNSRTKTEEKCVEELIDYVDCVDHCVRKTGFEAVLQVFEVDKPRVANRYRQVSNIFTSYFPKVFQIYKSKT